MRFGRSFDKHWLLATLIGLAVHAAAQSASIPGELRADTTFEHIGVVWFLGGDDDLDSSFSLEFRESGTITWRAAAPAFRAHPTLSVDYSPLGINSWGASAMFLQPGRSYELRATLSDPDGGGEQRTVVATTRTWPQVDPAGRLLHVVPGNGGGTGTLADPFLGLQAAADAALPGDFFVVGAGIYQPFHLLASGTPGSPIVFSGPADDTAVVDGADTARGVVTVGDWDRTVGYIFLEGLAIRNGRWGIDLQHSHDILIRHNNIHDVDYGILNRRGDGLESRQTVCDNTIMGRITWPGSGIPGERGIDLRGGGNVVCFNRVSYFGDCVSVQPFTGPSFGNDVHGNDASHCVDDGIEVDYNQANVRVWRNRVTNARMGVSVQPVRGGPAYILRNEFFNIEKEPIKMHNETTGFYVAHNTGVKHGAGYLDNGAMWRNAVLRNNLFLGTWFAFEFTTFATDGFRDFDHNAWGTLQATTSPSDPWFKWDNVRYDRLVDLQAIGVETFGVEAWLSDLVDAALPSAWDVAVEPGSRDLRLLPGVAAVDAGALLPNLNDPFPSDGAPDAGAFELGHPLPRYGPRPIGGVFDDDFESGSTLRWSASLP